MTNSSGSPGHFRNARPNSRCMATVLRPGTDTTGYPLRLTPVDTIVLPLSRRFLTSPPGLITIDS